MTENKQKQKNHGRLGEYLLSQTHISWSLTAIFIGFMLGVAATKSLDLSAGRAIWLAGGVVLSLICLASRLRLLIPLAVVSGMLLGVARAIPVLDSYKIYDGYIDSLVELRAMVNDDSSKIKTGLSLSLDNIQMKGGVKLPGKIWVSIKDGAARGIKRGDQIVVRGDLSDGFGNFNASMRLAKLIKIIRHPHADPMGTLRDNFALALGKIFNSDELNLGIGILTGQKSGLDVDMKNAFVAASLTHILVASGYNLTVLTRFIRRLLAKKSRIITILLSITFVLVFAGITGSSASMNRAVLVAIFSLITWYYGRTTHPIVLLSFVAFLTVLVSPSLLWGDAGWYMSFGSFTGVIILAPLIKAVFDERSDNDDLIAQMVEQREWRETIIKQRGVVGWLDAKLSDVRQSFGQIVIETASAQLMTLPIIAYFTNHISVIGLMTNLLVLPFLPLTMLLTFLAGVASLILPIDWAVVISEPARWLLDFINGVAKWALNVDGATMEFRPSMGMIILFYIVIIIAMVILKNITKHNFYGDNVIK